jgi:hypothetical protein
VQEAVTGVPAASTNNTFSILTSPDVQLGQISFTIPLSAMIWEDAVLNINNIPKRNATRSSLRLVFLGLFPAVTCPLAEKVRGVKLLIKVLFV